MPRRQRKHTLDTNLYIRAFRDPDANIALQLFHTVFAPFEYLSVIVVQELRAGAQRARHARLLQESLFDPFERRGRLLTPSYGTWKEAGAVLATLARADGLELGRISKGFANDVLLAMTCRDAGVVLVTENRRDFERIARVARFEFVDPWPAPAA